MFVWLMMVVFQEKVTCNNAACAVFLRSFLPWFLDSGLGSFELEVKVPDMDAASI